MRRPTINATYCTPSREHQASTHHQRSQLSSTTRKIEKCNTMFEIGLKARDNDQRDALNLPFDSVEPLSKVWVIKLHGNYMNLNNCIATI